MDEELGDEQWELMLHCFRNPKAEVDLELRIDVL
jgi:hypothetical protein